MLIMFVSPALAGDLTVSPKLATGHTSYVIQGEQSGGFKSELVFPIEVSGIEFDYFLKLDKKWVSALNFKISRNLTEEAGKFKDSDWLYSYGDKKIIYSYG